MNAVRAKVSETGRLSIPAEVRKAVGLERGGDVVVELEGRTIRIRTVEEVVSEAQGIVRAFFKGRKGVTVDDFIATRRTETGIE